MAQSEQTIEPKQLGTARSRAIASWLKTRDQQWDGIKFWYRVRETSEFDWDSDWFWKKKSGSEKNLRFKPEGALKTRDPGHPGFMPEEFATINYGPYFTTVIFGTLQILLWHFSGKAGFIYFLNFDFCVKNLFTWYRRH